MVAEIRRSQMTKIRGTRTIPRRVLRRRGEQVKLYRYDPNFKYECGVVIKRFRNVHSLLVVFSISELMRKWWR